MKLYLFSLFFSFLAIILNIFNYDLFLKLLSITWYIASVFIIYSAIIYSYKFKLVQFDIKKMIISVKSKSKNNISPLSSLCITLAAKIGVGSLSGVALAIYFGGLGSMFWLFVVSIIVSVNTYIECIYGIKYRSKIFGRFVGGPSYYIEKCLGNKKLAILYSILIIVTYSILFLSIQANTIVNTISYNEVNMNLVVLLLFISTVLIVSRGVKGIGVINKILVPVMLLFYLVVGVIIFIVNIGDISGIFSLMIREAFNIKSIIPVFLIGMQRAIFITESGLGTSAISAASCDNDADKQGMLEVMGIHITTFFVCFTTFLIIATSNYQEINYGNINGIEIVINAFRYHFGSIGGIILTIITIMFAFSTIISSYFFGESSLFILTRKKISMIIYKIIFMLVIIVSCYISPNILWNLTDYFIAILVIINVLSLLTIYKKNN
mgnify:FL=1